MAGLKYSNRTFTIEKHTNTKNANCQGLNHGVMLAS